MANETEQQKYRVSRLGGWLMIMVAFVLDFLPFIGLLAIAAFFVVSVNDSVVGKAAMTSAGWVETACERANDQSIDTASRIIYKFGGCWMGGGTMAAGVAVAGWLGFQLFGWWAIPLIYGAFTIVASLIAFLLFPVWFYFGKNYIMVSFLHPGKITVAFTSILFTTIFKLMPIVNLLPIPVYALTVWYHIRISRHEDREHFKEKQQKAKKKSRVRELMQRRAEQGDLEEAEQNELMQTVGDYQYSPVASS